MGMTDPKSQPSKATPSPDDALKALRQSVEGLTYPSDSDEPFDVFLWEANGTARDQVAAHAGKDRKLEEVPVEAFFAALDDADDAKRYRQLQRVLLASLKSLTIVRAGAGEVRVDVYLLGKLGSGQWAGVHTVSVET
jgi:hypothetical protein